jgi:hypothetical protein
MSSCFGLLVKIVGELGKWQGVKNLVRVVQSQPPGIIVLNKATPPSNFQKRLSKADEVEKHLRISKSGSYLSMQTGEIPVVKMGKAVRVKEEALESFVMNTKA